MKGFAFETEAKGNSEIAIVQLFMSRPLPLPLPLEVGREEWGQGGEVQSKLARPITP